MSSSLRILHVYKTYYPDPPGGVSTAIQSLCRSTLSLGVEHKVFTLSNNLDKEIYQFEDCEVHRSKVLFSIASCPFGGFESFVKFRQLSKWADIVLFYYPWPFADLLDLVNACPRKIIYYISDIVKQKTLNLFYQPLRVFSFKRANAIVTMTGKYAKTSEVLKKLRDVKVIPASCYSQNAKPDDEVLKKHHLEGRRFALFVGVLRYYKGVEFLIKAASSISCPLVIAGSGPEEGRLHALCQELNLNNVIFTGKVSDSEKRALFEACTLFALPSHLRSEAYGMVLLESAMYGKPMVTCEIGTGTSVLNIHNETGIVCEPAIPTALAQAINKIVGDESLCSCYGAAAYQNWEKHYTDDVVGKQWYRLFSDVKENRKFSD